MANRSARRKPCILIVDDDPDIREAMRDVITFWQCTVFAAASGGEALEILDHRHVDAVLCDLMMPGMDGAETLHEIKQRVPDLPVIIECDDDDRPQAAFVRNRCARLHG